MSSTVVSASHSPGWLRNQSFDLGFIAIPAIVAIASGALVVAEPGMFWLVLGLNLWVLGYHHVISTFTRLCFDGESFRQYRFLVVYLPCIILGVTLALAAGVGIWTISTIYLYWQWFHYTRQSWGISQIYRRKFGGPGEGEVITQLSFYLLPLWGILHRSWQAPEKFLGVDVWVVPVPGLVVDMVAVAAIGSMVVWGVLRIRSFLHGHGPIAHTLYMVSHFAIFAVGYLVIEDLTYGWLVINMWHNAQYVVFVWLYNNKKHAKGIDPKARFLSGISQTNKWPHYFLFCLALSTAIYLLISTTGGILAAIALPTIAIFQTINFHHYVVDGIIWKVRRPDIQQALGLNVRS